MSNCIRKIKILNCKAYSYKMPFGKIQNPNKNNILIEGRLDPK
jgi:hypothetical protein